MLWSKRARVIALSNCLLMFLMLFLPVLTPDVSAAQTKQASQTNTYFDTLRNANQASVGIDTYLKCIPTGIPTRAANYPDFYAGSYFDGEGKLAVMLTDSSPEIRQALMGAAGNSAVRFESATYSYEELTQISNIIYEKVKENQQSKKNGTHQPNICDDIRYALLLDSQNRIGVYINNLTQEKMRAFQNDVLDSSAVILRNADDTFQYLDGSAPVKKLNIAAEFTIE